MRSVFAILLADMNKHIQLAILYKQAVADVALPLYGAANLVFGEGNPEGAVLFIGEAPGKNEDEQMRPFVGRSGKILTKWIESIGWKREGVYITNIVKRRPPDNRDPLPIEISAYAPYLKEQIEIINPKIVAPLGRFSTNYFLPQTSISRDQGKIFWWNGRIVVPIFHPAAAMRNTARMRQSEETFVKLKRVVLLYDTLVALLRDRIHTNALNVDDIIEQL